ncbi:MAG: 2-amino-4-hydroxy-6-hydroxymethyldihydropteridine diphosphokinase [Geothrix sp.]|uniref:2-amino-4-hydroxy-6- hydroxymethyldihydropteridine diphosphokinase n=1 Tax=Geothrix sp. TaxID=1962974 RepID=UPI00181406B7|nr:2-amino-4-hydroxy-6-hydroxymethyldihydropteridine diphosphokinase [Geothrix sp.]NWJ41089.1 2-amino-4-hydroxy-6-hydroxymethyldihydropteridine diphosphokinase [Geothrix sp.]WIL20919.1 MAG: 2-amino-4-hydroxy-6-hydroxymethyldihydropteridine diphosphokinase [Geothrix sp.]
MKAVVALGSNLGDRRAHLEAGLAALRTLGAVLPSPLVMETPDESGRGPAYLNTVAMLVADETDPRRLLEALLRLELTAGRDRNAGRNAPRTLDLDLITTDGPPGIWTWDTPEDLRALGPTLSLELPHPRAFSRPFVLEPWRALSDPGECGGIIPKEKEH